jgi:hypothetical protein
MFSVGPRAVPGQREAVAALLDAQPATDAEREAVTWALGVLSAPIDDVVDLDPRFRPLHYQSLLGMAFPVARAAGLVERYLGRDAQQSVGRMRRAALVK